MIFLGIILKKHVVMWFFRVILKKNGDMWIFRENVEKNGVLAFFHALILESECTFGISATIVR